MDYEIYKDIINNLDNKEQQEKYTELIAIYLHNSLEIITTDFFLAIKNNLPDSTHVEGGAGILTIKNYPRSPEKCDRAMAIENKILKR